MPAGFHFGVDHTARFEAMSARRTARDAQTDTEILASDVERLLMITEALWAFVKEHHGLSDEELVRQITRIDMKDGKLDGRVEKTEPVPCSSCGRAMAKRRATCIYCGTLTRQDPFAR